MAFVGGNLLILYFILIFKIYFYLILDGANDCDALKKADVSLSLNEEEASLASDFTST